MKLPIYLDYMSTTPVDPRVLHAMLPYFGRDGVFGNPSSRTHPYGWLAQEAIERARGAFAQAINAQEDEIIWTSGGTEANNLAIKGVARFYRRQGNHLVTCMTEHKAVLDPCAQLQREGFAVSYLRPQRNGLIDLSVLEEALRPDTLLVSIMHANNEIGVIQNIKALGEITRARGILLHVDAVQSLGKIPIDVKAMQVDLMSFSAHKIYGPKGVGALYIRRNPRIRLEPLCHGGGQEQGLRSGTLPVPQIIGMAEALDLACKEMQAESVRILQLRNRLWDGMRHVGDVQLNGDSTQRLAGNLNVSFLGMDAHYLMESLRGLAVSSGSACTSGSSESSHVLRALGLSDAWARSSIRFSIGRFTTEAEIDCAVEQVRQIFH